MKVLKVAGIVAGVVALAATGAGLALGAAAGIAGVGSFASIATAASAVAALSQAGAQALQKKPPAQGSLSETLIGTNLPIPYVIGTTYTGGNLIHDVGYGGTLDGVPNPYRAMVYLWSLGPVQEVVPQVDFGAVGSYYSGFLSSTSQLGLTPEASALAGPYGAIPDWGSTYKLSGHAATLWSLKFDKKGKVFASGVPPLGALVTGPKAYDPRQDSTYPGGDGPCRPRDEDTYMGGEVPDNPGCAAVTYALGRYQNDKHVFGPGFEFDEIDWPAWIGFMNVCDENGWKADGTIYEGPGISKWDNLKRICAAGGGEPVPAGGILSVIYNAPKVALDTISRDDLADGEINIPGSRPWRQRINTIVPRYRSADHRWEYVQSDAVAVGDYVTLDGEEKVTERQYDLVQDKDQAARLAAYELVNARELDPIMIPVKPRLMRYRIGDALEIGADLDDDTGLGGRVVVITGREPDPLTGKVVLTVRTEDGDKHDFALGRTGTAPAVPNIPTGEDLDDLAGQRGAFLIISRSVDFPVTSDDDQIDIAAFTGVLDDGRTIAFPSGSVTGLSSGAVYAVLRSQSAGTYTAIASPASAAMANRDYIFLGWQATLSGGVPPTSPTPPPGYGGGGGSYQEP